MQRFSYPISFLLALLAILIVGYTPDALGSVEKTQISTPSKTWTPSITPRPTVTPRRIVPTSTINRITPTLTPTPPMISGPLSKSGPWFVFYSKAEKAFVAANDDGTGKKIIFPNISEQHYVEGSNSNLVAIITELPDMKAEYPFNLALLIISLPDGHIEKTIPLVLHPEGQDVNLWAVGDIVKYGIAWSPDGRYLAFIGAMDKPSTELYVYDSFSKNYSRLTYDAIYARSPEWSPNSQWIIYYEQNSTDGIQVVTGCSANIKTREVNDLHLSGAGVEILNWISADSFISLSHSGNETSNLYYSDLSLSKSTLLMPKDVTLLWYENSAAVNPQGQQIAYIATSIIYGSDFHGTYITSLSDPTPKRVSDELESIFWMSGINRYVGSPYKSNSCEILTITTDGQISCLKNHDSNSVNGFDISPDGQWLVASTSKGLLFYDNKLRETFIKLESGCEVNSYHMKLLVLWGPETMVFRCSSEKAEYSVNLKAFSLHPLITLGEYEDSSISWNGDFSGFFFNKNNNVGYYDIASGESLYIALDVDNEIMVSVGGNP